MKASKSLDTRFSFGGDSKEHITKYLGRIDTENNGKYELLTNKISKYLFYDYKECFLIENMKIED